MDIKQLNEILAQKDTKKILKEFAKNGFLDMTKNATLKHFSLEKIAKSELYESTDYHLSLKHGFSATLHDRIKDLSNHQVIWLQVDKIDTKRGIAIPTKNYIYFYKKI